MTVLIVAIGLGCHALWMHHLGLALMPTSGGIKLIFSRSIQVHGLFSAETFLAVLANTLRNLASFAGILLVTVGVVASVAVTHARRRSNQPTADRSIVRWLWLCTAAQLAVGLVGSQLRYEAWLLLGWTTVLTTALLQARPWDGVRALWLPFVALLLLPGTWTAGRMPRHSLHTWSQHGQMRRFAVEVVRGKVASFDIGFLAWQNPYGVVDLAGLADPAIAKLRMERSTKPSELDWVTLSSPFVDPSARRTERWRTFAAPLASTDLANLTASRAIKAATVYPNWFKGGLPADWLPLATLSSHRCVGPCSVQLFGTSQENKRIFAERLRHFSTTLPQNTRLN
ncbi:MAG: hypothetical protein EXR77_13730 [Myxococcales bacterium]|nr:hypothetical protein [Myxococcales bacterium]